MVGPGLALVGVLVVAILLGLMIRALPAVGALDRAGVRIVNDALGGPAGPASSLALGIDLLFGPLAAAALTVLAAVGGALLRRSRWVGLRIAVLVAVPWGAVEVVKIVVRRPRPDAGMLVHRLAPPPDSFSYPSGHTGFAAALCVAILLSLSVGRLSSVRLRRVALGLGVLIVLATVWSRVALGLHHPTDVLASAVLVPVVALLLARLLDVFHPDLRVRSAAGAGAGAWAEAEAGQGAGMPEPPAG